MDHDDEDDEEPPLEKVEEEPLDDDDDDEEEEEEEEEEEYKEDNCVLRLPDGTVHTVAGLESPSHARTPLPTITEQVNTADYLIVSYTSTAKYTYIIICQYVIY